MFSKEFMRFLINYQLPCLEKTDSVVKYFDFGAGKRRLAPVLLVNKK